MRAIITIDLGFGMSGKGSVIDALTFKNNTGLIVRTSGGSHCSQNVVLPDGTHHCFSQFGSGLLANPTLKTLNSSDVKIEPLGMCIEAKRLETLGIPDPLKQSYIHEECLITTPYHIALNRIKELSRGENRYGSTGHGIGETTDYFFAVAELAPMIKHLRNRALLISVLKQCQELITPQAVSCVDMQNPACLAALELLKWSPEELATEYLAFAQATNIVDWEKSREILQAEEPPVIFQGSQGVLLDSCCGFFPYVTSNDTTGCAAKTFISEMDISGETFTLGITRSYLTRHGLGPFPTEDEPTETSGMINTEAHNVFNEYQRDFRMGWFDTQLFQYALGCAAECDALCVTHTEYFDKIKTVKIGVRYEEDGKPFLLRGEKGAEQTLDLSTANVIYGFVKQSDFNTLLSVMSGLPVWMTSHGPTRHQKIM